MIPRLFNQIKNISYPSDIDILICSCGYEERCTYFASQFVLSDIPSKLVYKFNSPSDDRIAKHESFFKEKGFEIYKTEDDAQKWIREPFLDHLKKYIGKKTDLKVAIDISSMTRSWYAALMKTITQYDMPYSKIYCYYYYVESIQKRNKQLSSLTVQPIPGYSNIVVPEKPTALIIGMGNMSEVVNYLVEYFSAERVYCFYNSDKGSSLNKAEVTKWFYYDVHDLAHAFMDLWDLCKSLVNDYRIMVVPCGPKPFTLVSLLLNYILREVEIWKVGPLHSEEDRNTEATSDVIQLEILYISNKQAMIEENEKQK